MTERRGDARVHMAGRRRAPEGIGAAVGVAAILIAALIAASTLPLPAVAGEAAPADPLAGWTAIAGAELAGEAGGAARPSFVAGDLLGNHSEIAATVGQTTLTDVSAGAIGNNAIGGLDGLSTVIFNTGSAGSTAVSYQLNGAVT